MVSRRSLHSPPKKGDRKYFKSSGLFSLLSEQVCNEQTFRKYIKLTKMTCGTGHVMLQRLQHNDDHEHARNRKKQSAFPQLKNK